MSGMFPLPPAKLTRMQCLFKGKKHQTLPVKLSLFHELAHEKQAYYFEASNCLPTCCHTSKKF